MMSLNNSLADFTNDNIERFTLNGIHTYAKVLSITDGDTCDIVFYHTEMREFMRFKSRLLGYDASELNKYPWTAKLTRDYLAHICMGNDPRDFDESGIWEEDDLQDRLNESNNSVYVFLGEFDSFGRVLALFYKSIDEFVDADGESINDMMADYINKMPDSSTSSESSSDEE
ncbi:Hypothetical predicted protein [Paramuricea clavata]|uniref:Uncharacterized protein n=1 Tax=Paramuricea clavata TaxID=317549 RepID=A0A6S7KGE1_PARCT|nr:Hypothetical predicted protein [Paramuricea clavata]